MKTIIAKPSKNTLKYAAKLINDGELVAFPTETVYGLGANALDESAVKKIFKVKGRPQDNPLIVHISKFDQIKDLVVGVPKEAKILSKKFWPGPLTIVLKKSKIVPSTISAGLDTVAIRIPNNKIALDLIKLSKVPIAAPSANSSGKVSPTKAIHVKEDINKKIPLIIDGGECEIGVESTVIDLTKKVPIILRPGKITKEEIERVLHKKVLIAKKFSKKVSSPGVKYKHYSPNAKVVLFNKKDFYKKYQKYKNQKLMVLFFDNNIEFYTKNMFSFFRECDNKAYEVIMVEIVKEKGLGLALMNRLKKAALK